MTMRLQTGTGVTVNKLLTCPAGYKWRVIALHLMLVTGATAGNRQLQAQYCGDTTVDKVTEVIADTGVKTETSVNYAAVGGPSTATAAGGGSAETVFAATATTPWHGPLSMGQNAGQILILPSLVAGDTYTFYLLVDEVPDEFP